MYVFGECVVLCAALLLSPSLFCQHLFTPRNSVQFSLEMYHTFPKINTLHTTLSNHTSHTLLPHLSHPTLYSHSKYITPLLSLSLPEHLTIVTSNTLTSPSSLTACASGNNHAQAPYLFLLPHLNHLNHSLCIRCWSTLKPLACSPYYSHWVAKTGVCLILSCHVRDLTTALLQYLCVCESSHTLTHTHTQVDIRTLTHTVIPTFEHTLGHILAVWNLHVCF